MVRQKPQAGVQAVVPEVSHESLSSSGSEEWDDAAASCFPTHTAKLVHDGLCSYTSNFRPEDLEECVLAAARLFELIVDGPEEL